MLFLALINRKKLWNWRPGMRFDEILLTIISRLDGERYKHAAFHLMKGKRSGQTLQDTEYYGLHPFFGMLPSLSNAEFDLAYGQLLGEDAIRESDGGLVSLTASGRERADRLPKSRLNGWVYRGRERIFFARLALAVQTISHLQAGDRSFVPVTNDPAIQQDVRKVLLSALRNASPAAVRDEVVSSLRDTGMDDGRLGRLAGRLSGKGLTGLTWMQLSEASGMDVIDLKVEWVESLHIWLGGIESGKFPFLTALAEGIRPDSPLTGSARKTDELYRNGLGMEEIAARRGLKMSTIEDHFVEIAINDPLFPLGRFVPDEEAAAVAEEMKRLGTRKLSLLKEKFPDLSYFQLRLTLARMGKEDGNENDQSRTAHPIAETHHRI